MRFLPLKIKGFWYVVDTTVDKLVSLDKKVIKTKTKTKVLDYIAELEEIAG